MMQTLMTARVGRTLVWAVALASGLWLQTPRSFAGSVIAATQQSQSALHTRLQALGLPDYEADALAAQLQTRQIAQSWVERWLGDMETLASEGLPVSLMSELMIKGMTRGFSEQRINQAVQQLQEDLFWAKGVVEAYADKPSLGNSELADEAYKQIDNALRAGLGKANLRVILGNKNRSLPQISVLSRLSGDLRSRGLSDAQVLQLLKEWGASNMRADELEQLRRRIERGLADTPAPITPVKIKEILGAAMRSPPLLHGLTRLGSSNVRSGVQLSLQGDITRNLRHDLAATLRTTSTVSNRLNTNLLSTLGLRH